MNLQVEFRAYRVSNFLKAACSREREEGLTSGFERACKEKRSQRLPTQHLV